MLNLPGYRLTASIETNSQNHIYRGLRESDGEKVIIKILTAAYPSAADGFTRMSAAVKCPWFY